MSEILIPGGRQKIPIINESGLCSLVLFQKPQQCVISTPLFTPYRFFNVIRHFTAKPGKH